MKRFLSNTVTGILVVAAALFGGNYMLEEMEKNRVATAPVVIVTVPAVEILTETLTLYNGIAHATLNHVNQYTYQAMWKNLMILKARNIKELHLTQLNPGGSIFEMWGIYDSLKEMTDNDGLVLHTYVEGMIASAAVPIFLLGQHRSMDEHAFCMIHSHNVGQSEYQPESFNRMVAKWTEEYINILLARTNMDLEEIKKYMSNDGDPDIQLWMSKEDAQKRGFLTK